MLAIVFLIIQLGFAVYLIYFIITFISGAPFVPSTRRASEAMIRMAGIKRGMKVYDLGSGDGRLLFLAAEKGARAVGYELNPMLVLLTFINMCFSPERKFISVRWKTFWKADIGNADIIFVYLLPISLKRLKEMIRKKARPGTLIVSNSFIFPGWKPFRQDTANHVYVFKA